MKQTKLTELRKNLSSLLNDVNNKREPLMVTRRRGKPVVMMSLEDYEAMGKPVPRTTAPTSVDELLNSFIEVDEITFFPHAVGDLEKI